MPNNRMSWWIGGALTALLALLLIDPRWLTSARVTFYMPADCASCRSYARYLRSQGFWVTQGPESELPTVLARLRLPPPFRSRHVAVIDGLFVAGHVPAPDIRARLDLGDRGQILGLVVPGEPAGAPGLPSLNSGHYTVFAFTKSGLVIPVATYHTEGFQ